MRNLRPSFPVVRDFLHAECRPCHPTDMSKHWRKGGNWTTATDAVKRQISSQIPTRRNCR